MFNGIFIYKINMKRNIEQQIDKIKYLFEYETGVTKSEQKTLLREAEEETDTTSKKSTNPKWHYLFKALKSTSRTPSYYNSGILKWQSSQSKDGKPETTNEFPVIVLSIGSSEQVVKLVGNEKSEDTIRDIQSKLKNAGFSKEHWGYDYSNLSEEDVVTALKSITPLIV